MRNLLVTAVAGLAIIVVNNSWADVPAPPVNQDIGMFDGLIGDMQEADCRVCHDSGVPDRHHVLLGQPIPPGSLVPFPDANQNGVPDEFYGCLNCHDVDFTPVRDCTVCHTSSPHHTTPDAVGGDCVACHGDIVDNINDGHYIPAYSPSLVTPAASGGEGLPLNSRGIGAGACNYCHDDDGLATPTILTTPNLHHSVVSNCTLCHDGNPMDFHTDREDGVLHAPGKDRPFTNGCTDCHGADLRGGYGPSCFSCHGREWENDSGSGHSPSFNSAVSMRKCEGCHGPESLHGIQADTSVTPGQIVVGGELAGFGHVGRDAGPGDSDCWGCHGFAMAAVPGLGPVTPTLYHSDVATMTAGADATIILSGAGFTNLGSGTLYESDVRLTAADGSVINLQPDIILDEGRLAVTIPQMTPPGNYRLQVTKDQSASNPTVISITPTVQVRRAVANRGLVSISGSGFGQYAQGSGTTVTGTYRARVGRLMRTTTVVGTIVSWSDGSIVATFPQNPRSIAVQSVFGRASYRLLPD